MSFPIIVRVKGFRTRKLDIVTTLLDPTEYSRDDLGELYFRRWSVELYFRHIKTTMGMDTLRGKSPEIVRKEIVMFAIAYNLIRATMQGEPNGVRGAQRGHIFIFDRILWGSSFFCMAWKLWAANRVIRLLG